MPLYIANMTGMWEDFKKEVIGAKSEIELTLA
jgi:hypothetical protein